MIIAIGNKEAHLEEEIIEREPMQTMQGMIHFPMAESEELLDMEKNLMSAKRVISLMGSQINELLEYVKIEKGLIALKKQAFSKDELQKQLEFLLQPLCEDKALTYTIDCEKMEDVPFMVDKGMFVQMLWQLLDNAALYTYEGGEITFEAYTEDITDKIVTNCFIIKDNGIGISEAFQKYLFQPFMREKNRMYSEVEGTGLGLYIVYQIIKLMHGKIQIESKEDEGTIVTIHLTSLINKHIQEEKNKALEDLSILQRKRILVCVDRMDKAKALRNKLEMSGMFVDIATDGYEVVELFRNSKRFEYDAILVNVRMEIMDGFEITNRIRHLDREDAYLIPIIALIKDTYDESLMKPIEGGMDAQIIQPVKMSDLMSVLVEYWGKYRN